jgi:hypothetical protein
MSTLKSNYWLNLIASVGVLIGLALVATELRQNNELAEAETVRSLWETDNELRKFELQTDILPVLITSINEPFSLTDQEIVRLDGYLSLILQHQLTIATMRDSYGLAASETTIEAQSADIVDTYLRGRFARGWFAASEYWISTWHADLVDAINQELGRVPVEMRYSWPDEIRSNVKRLYEDE